MELQLLYFAALRDRVGKSEESLVLGEPEVTVTDLLALLERRHPGLKGCLGGVRVAVNECFAEAAESIRSGDVVALIPPVAGG
ncbi:MAG TPA: MoaD/ThiS family protein [Polyangiaceae bacterium]